MLRFVGWRKMSSLKRIFHIRIVLIVRIFEPYFVLHTKNFRDCHIFFLTQIFENYFLHYVWRDHYGVIRLMMSYELFLVVVADNYQARATVIGHIFM